MTEDDEISMLVTMGLPMGVISLFMGLGFDNPGFYIVSLLVWGIVAVGVLHHKIKVRRRAIELDNICPVARKLRREFRGTPLKEIKLLPGFGDGIYGD
jgi:hypothetical protein